MGTTHSPHLPTRADILVPPGLTHITINGLHRRPGIELVYILQNKLAFTHHYGYPISSIIIMELPLEITVGVETSP